MDRDQVIARIEDWARRLEGLYKQVEAWYQVLPCSENKTIFTGSVLQWDEDLMRQFDVPPRMLPTRAILYGKNRVSFVPGALWTLGANGRVNVTVGDRQHVLLDLGGQDGRPSDWQIVTTLLTKESKPFNRQIFNNLVMHQAIEAA